MAVGTYEITHEKILESGRQLFLQNGYERTNLRALCKGAGITTGAFYRHFEDKEALFAALVDPVIKGLKERYEAAGEECFDFGSVENIDQLWTVSIDTMAEVIRYIFAHFDAFKLLLCCSDGTRYVNFNDWMVEKEVEDSLKLYAVMEQKNISFHKLTVKEMHMLYHSYYSCIFETVMHDYTEEEALQCTHTLAKFFTAGWREAHGL
ncbi:MAG: TetR/AcrR family transcriptional regulator [Peptococcaceae bacterium]|nr:TetR/AcrR family transcriptional regulator [Peptococcaceae bacterium]